MNWLSSPPVMRPASTSEAPTHSTMTMPAPTRKITSAVITARILVRRMAAMKESSTAPLKLARSTSSWVKACTVCTAFNASLA